MSQSEGSDRGEGLTSGQRHAPRVTWTERAAMSLMDRISDGPHSEEDVRTTLRFLAAVEDVRQELVDEAPAVAARQLQDLDNALTETIKDRDCYHEWADRLAGAIARHFGEDIGEHSNVNNPWAAALGVILDAGPMAGEVSINGLTEAETAATASVSGLAVHAVLAEQVAPIA